MVIYFFAHLCVYSCWQTSVRRCMGVCSLECHSVSRCHVIWWDFIWNCEHVFIQCGQRFSLSQHLFSAFICHHNSFMIYGSLREPTLSNWSLVTHVSVGSAVVVSAVFAAAGYATFTGYTQGNYIKTQYLDQSFCSNEWKWLFQPLMIKKVLLTCMMRE